MIIMDKRLRDKIILFALWLVPLAVLFFCFYRFAIKPTIWLMVFGCIASVFLGWMMKEYFEV